MIKHWCSSNTAVIEQSALLTKATALILIVKLVVPSS